MKATVKKLRKEKVSDMCILIVHIQTDTPCSFASRKQKQNSCRNSRQLESWMTTHFTLGLTRS